MTKAPIRNRMRALPVASLLQNVAVALRNHDQLIAHRRRCGVADRAIQLPTCATLLTMATDDLEEAGHSEYPFDFDAQC